MTDDVLKIICDYDGDGETLRNALVTVGFALGYPNSELGYLTGISVPKWAEMNSKLIANWDNGVKGGRPKTPANKLAKTSVKTPQINPTITQQKPNDNPSLTDRVDRIDREEEIDDVEATSPPILVEEVRPSKTPDYEITLKDLTENVRQATLQVAQHYCMRRYKGPKFHETWYPKLLLEIAGLLEVTDDPKAACETFRLKCNEPMIPTLDRNATFSEIALACGLKKAKPPPWEVAKQEKNKKAMDALDNFKVADYLDEFGRVKYD